MPPIEVLLAAYNGAAFIREQIQSILDQDYDGLITIHVRDDGSTDHTVALALGQPRHTTYLLWHKFRIGFKRVFF